MSLPIDATYENGMLRPDHPLPLHEGQRVRIVIQESTSIFRETYGIIAWNGDAEVIRRVALDPEFGIWNSW